MKFQSIVIIILIVLLIITIVSFYIIATRAGNNMPYPPTIPVCPDYYYQTGSTDGNITCKAMPGMANALQKSTMSSSQINACVNPYFTSDYYTGTNANCLKYTWYSNCNAIPAWEGVTYGVTNPCST